MRKILLAGAALLATTGMAMATSTGVDSVTITATNPPSCSVSAPADITSINPSSVAAQPIGDFTYTCNVPGFTRIIGSTNDGKLLRNGTLTGPGNEVTYSFSHAASAGSPELALAAVSLATDAETIIPADTDFINGETAGGSVTITGDASSLFSGAFSDTITVELTY